MGLSQSLNLTVLEYSIAMNELLAESESLTVFAPFLLTKSLQNVLGIIVCKECYRGVLLIRNGRKTSKNRAKKQKNYST